MSSAGWAKASSGNEPPPPPKWYWGDIMRGVASAVVLVVSIAVRIWFAHDTDSDRARPVPGMAPTHPYADTFSARTLTAGTCLDRVPIGFARPVPCDQSHISEIVAVFPYAAPAGAGYPPIVDLYRQSLDRCKTDRRRRQECIGAYADYKRKLLADFK